MAGALLYFIIVMGIAAPILGVFFLMFGRKRFEIGMGWILISSVVLIWVTSFAFLYSFNPE